MINILIIEDDNTQLQNLTKVLYTVSTEFNIYKASNKNDALTISNDVNIDLFFVDICLGDSSGLEFASELRKEERYEFSFIIFLTTHVEYITQAFKKVHCYDYILKPYDKSEIIEIVNKINGHAMKSKGVETEKKFVLFKLKSEIDLKIYIDEINFIETQGRDCIVNTIKTSYTIKKLSLKKAIEIINCEDIMQSHKSYLVNVRNICRVEKIDGRLSQINFKDSQCVAFLGYKFRDSVLENFHQIIM